MSVTFRVTYRTGVYGERSGSLFEKYSICNCNHLRTTSSISAGSFASDSLTALVPPAAANPFASGELPGTVVASESGAGRNRENVTPI